VICVIKRIQVASQLIEAVQRNGDSYTWTLASQLGNMLRFAQSQFGSRDKSYTILGVEFIHNEPRIWYPDNCKNIVIQLGTMCLLEPDRACFQLAHETIHLLSPTKWENVNVLEEGLAAYFQVWYMNNQYPRDWPRSKVDWTRLPSPYEKAKILVERLLGVDQDAIRRLREQQPRLSQITAEEIRNAYPALDRYDALALTTEFPEYQNTELPDARDAANPP
jgi:hypothetical protein